VNASETGKQRRR